MTFKEFIKRISIATQYTFTDDQVNRIRSECEKINESYLTRICSTIERSPNHPKNIYGLVLGNIEWANDELKAERLKVQRRNTKEEYATPEEISLTFEITTILMQFENSGELLLSFNEHFTAAIKKGMCLEFLKKAKQFYLDKIKEGVKLKKQYAV